MSDSLKTPFQTLFRPVRNPRRLFPGLGTSLSGLFQKMRGPADGVSRELRAFRPRIRFSIEKGQYLIKTAESFTELEAALRLRWRTFFGELMGRTGGDRLEADRFDAHCDHLLIIDHRTGDCVGTYRMMCSLFSEDFYSAGEFDIRELLDRPGVKLELGRACIAKSHRASLGIALLWRGIVRYFQKVGARYLFGCSSIPTTDYGTVRRLMAELEAAGHIDDRARYPARWHHKFNNLPWRARAGANGNARGNGATLIPPLLESYLRLGAKVGPEPALDRSFQCTDLFTIFDTQKVTPAFTRKFLNC